MELVNERKKRIKTEGDRKGRSRGGKERKKERKMSKTKGRRNNEI